MPRTTAARSRGIARARRLALPGGPGRGGALGLGGFRGITITRDRAARTSRSRRTTAGRGRSAYESTTTITKGGATITVGDLAVGDKVRFGQKRAADGTYNVTAIVVVLPTVVGEVTAIDGNTITVTQPGGTTATIHVDGHTTYRVDGATGSLSDVKVGSFIVAEGTQRTDGSLDAAAIRGGEIFGSASAASRAARRRTVPSASPAPSSGAS